MMLHNLFLSLFLASTTIPKADADPYLLYGGYGLGYGGYGLGYGGYGGYYRGYYYGKREANAAETKSAYYDGHHSIEKVLNFGPF